MKILIAGCSWSSGYGIEPKDAYPFHLQNLIEDCEVVNLAHPGTSFTHSVQLLINGVKKHLPDVVIFQGTTLDRVTLGIHGYSNFINENYLTGSKALLHITQEVVLKAIDGDIKYFDKLADNLQYSGVIQELMTAVKFYGLHTMYDQYTVNNYMITLASIQSYLNENNIKHLFFPYLHFTWEGGNRFNIWETEFGRLPNLKNIIREPFETWLKSNTTNNYYIDSGFHLNVDGHKILAEDYLLPKLRKIINEN